MQRDNPRRIAMLVRAQGVTRAVETRPRLVRRMTCDRECAARVEISFVVLIVEPSIEPAAEPGRSDVTWPFFTWISRTPPRLASWIKILHTRGCGWPCAPVTEMT